MNRQEYRDSVRAGAVGRFVCVNCGQDSYRRLSGTNKSKGHKNKYCCMACRVQHAEKVRQEIVERLALVAREIKAIRRLGIATYKPAKFRCKCRNCGTEFVSKRNGGLHQVVCAACKRESERRNKRIAKAKRRARERGVSADAIDPLAVFERDKWRCHICKAKTQKKHRGTFKDTAPELDHIVSLADGGTHTWGNVACACRKCNGAKGSASFGQLGLALAA